MRTESDDPEMAEVLIRFDEPGGTRSVLLEDDGSVAYAYLLEGDMITGDVWLYNVGEAPETVNWRDRCPFAILPSFAAQKNCPGLDQVWTSSATGQSRVQPFLLMGWFGLASKPGPNRAGRELLEWTGPSQGDWQDKAISAGDIPRSR